MGKDLFYTIYDLDAESFLEGVSANASVVVGTVTRCASASIGSSPMILIIFPSGEILCIGVVGR